MKKEQYTYLLARLPLAMSFFGHGLIRLTKLDGFANGMAGQFSKSFLPGGLVLSFGYVLPFLEFLTGLLLLIGFYTRFAAVLGVVIILSLIFGSSVIEKWDMVFTQLFYGVYLAALFYFADYDKISIDGWRSKKVN